MAVGAPGFVLGCHSFIVKIVYCCYTYRACYSRSYFILELHSCKGISLYIDEIQSWVEVPVGLRTRSYAVEDKKRLLLRNLARVPNITHLLQTCEDRSYRDFEETCHYLRTNSMIMDRVNSSSPRTYAMMITTLHNPEEPDLEDVMERVHLLMQETSPVQVYQALRSPIM